MRRFAATPQPDAHGAARLILLQSSEDMSKSKTLRSVKVRAATRPATAQDKVALALKHASSQAHKQLAAQGLKLPTQSWTGAAVRNPAI
jgi:hypothetical protein